MSITTWSGKLRKGLAVFGAAALLAGTLGPVAAFADPSVETGETSNQFVTSDDNKLHPETEVRLTVTDVKSESDTISVTAPLKIYLAVDSDTAITAKDYEFITPSKGTARITNTSKGSKVKLVGYEVADNEGQVHGYKESEYRLSQTKKSNDYWLQADINNHGKAATLELGETDNDLATTLGVNSDALILDQNNSVGDGFYSSLVLDLKGEIYQPLSDVTSFGNDGGGRLSTITWTFEKADN